jgi:hypothetical protein
MVAGCLRRLDFERARAHPGLSVWRSHGEFMSERDALLVSYAAAGVTAIPQRVPFEAFESWSRLTGAPINLDGLDEFAAHWRWRGMHGDAPVIGKFGCPGDPERNYIAAAGAQRVCIRPEVFLRWRDDFAKSKIFAPPDLDVYAAYVVECCISAFRAARRPAISSA